MGTKLPVLLAERKAQCKPLVLVVDDDAVHHKLFEILSSRLGITVHVASSCGEAVEALSMFSFDLILMDYRMPQVDGCMCTKHIRALKEVQNNIPIIAVTAHTVAGSREDCIKAGMNDFLAKPFTLDQLNQKLSYWLQKKIE